MLDMRTPVAYLRRSASVDPSREQSREMQEASVRRMASAFEGLEPELYVDWNISGARKDRVDYQRLRAAVAEDRVSTVYSYSLSRFGRNATELLAFFELCRDHGTKVVTEAEGALSAESAMGKFLLTIMSAVSELERNQAAERSASARAIRQERGDVVGAAPMGFLHVKDERGVLVRVPDPESPVATVLAAYRDAGTVLGAVKLLNTRGVPSPRGKRWGTSALTRVIETNEPGLLPARGLSGKRIRATAVLSQLVRCHCGHVMTPNTRRRQLYCSHWYRVPGHGRYSVAESVLMPWIREEAAHFRVPADTVAFEADNAARRETLEAQRARAVESYIDGHITKADRDRRLEAVENELALLDAADKVVTVPDAIDWTKAPEDINDHLRALWSSVQLDDDMRPVDADWLVPEWRTA